MSALTLNGASVTAQSITIPYYGPWAADVALAADAAMSDAATLVIGDLTLKGTVRRVAAFSGSKTARIVGGAGGWRKTLKPKAYDHAAGVKRSTVLQDAARECGESLVLATDKVIGTHYQREEAQAERVLHLLTDGHWWIDTGGVTRTAARDSSMIASPFTVVGWTGGKGRFEIATENPAAWQPGRRFTAPTVSGTQTISSVSIGSDNAGKLRLSILSTDGGTERLRDSLRSLIRAELASFSYAGVWEYEIASGTPTTVDATSTDSRMPDVTKCPMYPGLLGEVVTPTPGTKCLVAFVNMDPTRPICIAIEGIGLTAIIDASVAVRLGAGVKPAIGAGDLAGIFPCIPTQFKVLV